MRKSNLIGEITNRIIQEQQSKIYLSVTVGRKNQTVVGEIHNRILQENISKSIFP